MKKMIISDYDDTFYINDSDIKGNVNLANEFMKENIFVIATGRSFLDFQMKKDIYDIKSNYLIINHGATVVKDNRVIENYIIEDNIKDSILKEIDSSNIISTFCCSTLDSRKTFSDNQLTKIHIKYKNKYTAINDYKKLGDLFSEHINCFLVSRGTAIEIVSKQVDKSIAIEEVRKAECVDIENIYTIGDSYNDIGMIKKYKGHAMQNSVEELKQYSLRTYLSVSELIKDVLNEK